MRGLILVAALAVLHVLAQKVSADSEALLDPTRPSAYLEWAETGLDSGGQSAVWLRLHNNSKGAISIRTESLYIGEKVQPLTLRTGKGVLAIRPGTTVAPCYTVEGVAAGPSDGRAQTINEQPYQRLSLGSACTVGATSWIPSGGNIRLQIPSEHLSSGRRISIAFEYEWENARNLEHRVYFSDESRGQATTFSIPDFFPQLRLPPSLVNAGSRRRLGLSSIGRGVSFGCVGVSLSWKVRRGAAQLT